MKKNILTLAKIISVLFLVVGVVFGPLPTTPRAHAVIPVSVITNTDVIQDIWDGIGWVLAKVAIQSMTKSIVNWINSGYEGEPAFSQNLSRDLRQASDGIAGKFLTDFFAANIDSPFLSLARDSVSVYYLLTSEDALAQRLKYSLGSFAQRSTDYIRGDWSGGGLSGWYGLTFKCENDPNCSSFLVHEALAQRIDAQSRKFIAEFNAGRGFLSWQGECSLYESQTGNNTAFQRCVADNQANGTNNDCFALYGNMGTSLGDADKCVEHDVLTPGAVVEQTLVENLGSPLRQLELADSINEIVAAAVTQLVGQVLGGNGLSGVSKPRSAGSGRPIDQSTNPNVVGTNLNAGFSRTVMREREQAELYRSSWLDIRTVSLEAQDACPIAGGTVNAFRTSRIRETINQANTAIARAESAIAELDSILQLIENSSGNGVSEGGQVASSQSAYEEYQRLLASGQLITAAESETALAARDENVSDSLYSEMQGYVNACD